MILHLVTDRRRLSTLGRDRATLDCVVQQARYAAAAGIDVIQVREPDLDARDLAGLVSAVIVATRHSGTRVLVNDRIDVALACGADGVHLRADSPDAQVVRRLVPAGFLLGRSVHSVAEAAAPGPVDYLIAGTVWPTHSKPPGHPILGLAGLKMIVAATSVPVLAIGGVTADNAPELARAGVSGVAGIGVFMAAGRESCRAVPLAGVAQRLRHALDGGDRANMRTFLQR